MDDGIATGATLESAIKRVKKDHPKRVVIATPLVSPEALAKFQGRADEVFCLLSPATRGAVGEFYEFFSQVFDEEVIRLLR